MPRMPNITPPKYRKHKPSGQAVVTICGKDNYLGPYNSLASKVEYDRLIAEWLANGRRLASDQDSAQSIKIFNLIDLYLNFAESYYRRLDGTPAGEVTTLRSALQLLYQLYAQMLAEDFGPLALKAVRQKMLEKNWSRGHINDQVGRIKSMFRWAVENEMVPATVHHGLIAVRGLARGRCDAREGRRVRPVSEALISPICPHVAPQVWAMIELQLLTGMRPGEVVLMQGLHLETTGKVWTYLPESHKTAHHGHSRRIFIGPRAQDVLKPFLKPDLNAYLFSPIEAEKKRRAVLTANRRTPLSCGNRPGTHRKPHPVRRPDKHYSVDSYRRAIERGCFKAFPPPSPLGRAKGETHAQWKKRLTAKQLEELSAWQREHRWHPHQLRHNAATRLRKEFGIEVARVILGHRSPLITEVYAELDDAKAIQVIQKIG